MAKKSSKKQAVSPDLKIERAEREIQIPLGEKEIRERAEIASHLQREVANLEAGPIKEVKEELGELKKSVKEKSAERDRLLLEIDSKSAKRLVECDEVLNFETKRVEYYFPKYEDGARPADSREFTPEEHQVNMFKKKSESIPSTGDDPLETEGA